MRERERVLASLARRGPHTNTAPNTAEAIRTAYLVARASLAIGADEGELEDSKEPARKGRTAGRRREGGTGAGWPGSTTVQQYSLTHEVTVSNLGPSRPILCAHCSWR